jgi:GntR family transcriptional repressor for pyruvate dehydrogenase complex
MLGQIERVTTTRAIVDQVISLMKSGDLKPGDRLPSENELMELMGVGRSSIREAKQTLIAMGLIEAHPGRGSYIREVGLEALIDGDVVSLLLSDEHVMALHEARELLEVQVVALAAGRATADDLATLKAALDRMADAVAANESVYDPGMEFHVALVKAAHNPVLVKLYDPIIGLLREYQQPVYEGHSDPAAELRHHRMIFESIRAGDSELAQNTMRMHLDYVIATIKASLPQEFAHG